MVGVSVAPPASAAPGGVDPTGKGGYVVAWGANTPFGQTTLPESLSGQTIVAIDAENHTLALTAEGKIIAWGDDFEGQCTPPAFLEDETVTAVSAGLDHSLALTDKGRVVSWGTFDVDVFAVPAWLEQLTIVDIAAGQQHSVALTAEGTVVAWGANTAQELDIPESLTGKTVTDIEAGGYQSLALTSEGKVIQWGRRSSGQGDVPNELSDKVVTTISASTRHNLALTADGQVFAWGTEDDGRTAVPESLSDETVVAIAAGFAHSVAVTADGEIVAWGRNTDNRLDVPESLDGRRIAAVTAGERHNVVIVGYLPPTVTAQPGTVEVTAGNQATFTAEVTSEGPATTRWQRAEPSSEQFMDLPDAAGTTYTTPALTVADSGARYRLVATSPGGEAFSDPATVTVVAPATISGDAPSGTATVAYAYAYAVAGAPAPAVVVEGQLPPGLSISAAGRITGTPTAAGTFTHTVRATNAVGSATLNDTITIAAAPVQEANLAVRVSGPASAQSGKSVTYQIVVTNNGPATATNVKTVLGASSFSVKSTKPSTGSGSIKIRNTPVSGSLLTTPTLAPGASVTFEITGQFTAKKGQIAAVAGGSLSSVADPALTNNLGGLAVRIT